MAQAHERPSASARGRDTSLQAETTDDARTKRRGQISKRPRVAGAFGRETR